MDVVRRRVRNASQPGQRSDSYKVGLAIEGGGMRGILSAGMLLGMDYLGCTDAFDAVYGSSAGAINAAWLLARQGAYACTVYYDNISNSRFLNIWRLLAGKPAVSLEYLLDEVMTKQKVMDWRTVIHSPIELKVVASSLDSQRSEVLSGFKTREELWEALRASARMPILAGPPVRISNRRYMDAMLYESIPYRSALADGCTHVLVVRTRPFGVRKKSPSRLVRKAIHLLSDWRHPEVSDALARRADHYNRDVDELTALQDDLSEASPFVYSIHPPAETASFEQTEISRAKVLAAAIAGMRCSIREFTGREPQIHEVLRPYWEDGEDVRL